MKCKTGYSKEKGVCIPGKRLVKSATKKSILISKLALFGSLVSIGGWALFTAIIQLTHLETLNPWVMGLAGLSIVLMTAFLGWGRMS